MVCKRRSAADPLWRQHNETSKATRYRGRDENKIAREVYCDYPLHGSDQVGHACLDVLNHPGVDGLLETLVLTCKFAKVAGLADVIRVAGLIEVGVEGSRPRHGLVGGRQEDDLAVGALGHGLHGLEVPDLHGRRRRQDVGSLAHELGRFDL